MMLRRPVAQAAQTRCGPIHEPHSVFREPRFYDRSQGCRRHAHPRGVSKLPMPIWLLLKDTGLAYRTARFSDHPPLAPPTHLTPLRFNSSHEHSGLPAMNDVAVCWRFDDQRLARTQESSI